MASPIRSIVVYMEDFETKILSTVENTPSLGKDMWMRLLSYMILKTRTNS